MPFWKQFHICQIWICSKLWKWLDWRFLFITFVLFIRFNKKKIHLDEAFFSRHSLLWSMINESFHLIGLFKLRLSCRPDLLWTGVDSFRLNMLMRQGSQRREVSIKSRAHSQPLHHSRCYICLIAEGSEWLQGGGRAEIPQFLLPSVFVPLRKSESCEQNSCFFVLKLLEQPWHVPPSILHGFSLSLSFVLFVVGVNDALSVWKSHFLQLGLSLWPLTSSFSRFALLLFYVFRGKCRFCDVVFLRDIFERETAFKSEY